MSVKKTESVEELATEHAQSNTTEKDVITMSKQEYKQQVESIQTILKVGSFKTDGGFTRGLKTIASIVEFDAVEVIPGMPECDCGVMAFRRKGNNLNLAFACGVAPTFYCPLNKYVQLIEQINTQDKSTVLVQNCSDRVDGDNSRGQVLARLNTKHSAIQVIWGQHGKVVYGPDQISKQAAYYIPRDTLLSFYMAAKAQVNGGTVLEELLNANDGWLEYSIPTNPLDPAEG